MAFDRQIAALTIYCEASSCPLEEQLAVAHTIVNRVPKWQPTVAGVCLQRMQFSEWNADQADNKNLLRGANAKESDLFTSLQAYDLVAITPDPTNGATHYHDKSITPPYWATTATKTLETAHFIFYKDVH